MTTLRVGIATLDEYKNRTLAIARGDLKPGPLEPKIWFSSIESFAKVLSERNRDLLRVIAESRPASLQELAEKTGRAKSNLSRTLRTMIGTCDHSRTRRQTSRPSRIGRPRSSRMTSGRQRAARSSAAWPSAATTTA